VQFLKLELSISKEQNHSKIRFNSKWQWNTITVHGIHKSPDIKVIILHMTACYLVWGHQSFRTIFLHLRGEGCWQHVSPKVLVPNAQKKCPLLPQRKSQPVLTAVNGGHAVSQTNVGNWKFYSTSNFTLCDGVQGYLLPCSLPGMVYRFTSRTCLGTVNKYKTYFICLNMLSQTLYQKLASCITCACQS
jgi:hypothetical protein